MPPLSPHHLKEYQKQMQLGTIPGTYKALIEYMMSLRTYFKNKTPEYVVGSFYQGYMDMTYFPIVTTILQESKLKLAIVFNHFNTRFEIWLSAQNRDIQKEYLKVFRQMKLDEKYMMSGNPDSIIEMMVIESPDFKESEEITTKIETGIKKFVKDLTAVLP